MDIIDVGPWGLLVLSWAFIGVAFVKGWIVTKSVLDIWVAAYRTEREARDQQDGVIAEMAEGIRLSVDMLRSIKATAARRRNGDDS